MAPDVVTGGGRGSGRDPLVSNLVAHDSNIAVIGGDVHGDIIFGGELRTPRDLVLDFGPLIAAATRGFVGRTAIFDALASVAATHDRGYIEIEGDAGVGKTALAAAIARRYDAVAFFASAGRGLTLPKTFLTHACAALITRYALPHDHLPSRAGDDGAFLARVLKEAAAVSPGPVWMVVDALDEAEAPPPRANPLLLPSDLPPRVFIVVTRRPGGRLWTQPGTPRVPIELRADAPQQLADIETHIRERATEDGPLRDALRDAVPPVTPDTLVRTLTAASRGNFMYVGYVLADIEGRRPGTPLDLTHLPDGLQGYYEQFWSDMAQARADGWADWKALYRPVIERLAVAAEAVSARWIGTQIDRDPDEVRERALLRWTRLLSQDVIEGEERWRVVHRSFADFLASKIDLPAVHRAVAAFYATDRLERPDEWDAYGLRHTPAHLAAAAAGSDEATRHALSERLASLVRSPAYQQRHLTTLRDPVAFERAVALAVQVLARDAQATLDQVVATALHLVAFRSGQRQPAPIFDLAAAGDVAAAERRLDLFALDVDADWYDALLLTIAWLAGPRRRDDARRLRDRVRTRRGALPTHVPVDLLRARVDVDLDGAPMPPLTLPDPPPPEDGETIVLRLQASSVDRSLMPGAAAELLDRGELSAGPGGYLAEHDGPALISLALHAPAIGEPLLEQYLAMHAAYGYREYRQASLAWLLRAVLQHPSQPWVLTHVTALGAAVLAPNRGEFREALALATLAREAAAGDGTAVVELERRRADALAASDAAVPITGPSVVPMPRGSGDAWGTHRRRLAALAEALRHVPGHDEPSRLLLTRALGLQWGFAGFNAPACLAVADAIAIAAPDLGETRALAAALTSARNIQDATFCVRTTARVQAISTRWSGPPGAFDVAGASERLARDPAAPEFSGLHLVGQRYDDRDPVTTVPLGDDVRAAASLRQLSAIYARPLEDFLWLNAGRSASPDAVLPHATPVQVPDPGLPPLLAAHFAARALVDPMLTPDRRAATIRRLVPPASADATALDLVLARLVLASADTASGVLADIRRMAGRTSTATGPDPGLGAQLTRFVP